MAKTLFVSILAVFLSACYTASSPYGPPPPGHFPPHQTPLPQQGQMCGGIMGAQCSNPNEFCQYSPQAQCGAADQSGVCSPRPEMCTMQYQPVCTCSGKTYSNACVAAANGESVVYEGQCRQ